MPHLVIDHGRLGELRSLMAQWDTDDLGVQPDNDAAEAARDEDVVSWAYQVAPLLRALVDPRGELPDRHEARA